jgi:hypothetical protein
MSDSSIVATLDAKSQRSQKYASSLQVAAPQKNSTSTTPPPPLSTPRIKYQDLISYNDKFFVDSYDKNKKRLRETSSAYRNKISLFDVDHNPPLTSSSLESMAAAISANFGDVGEDITQKPQRRRLSPPAQNQQQEVATNVNSKSIS